MYTSTERELDGMPQAVDVDVGVGVDVDVDVDVDVGVNFDVDVDVDVDAVRHSRTFGGLGVRLVKTNVLTPARKVPIPYSAFL